LRARSYEAPISSPRSVSIVGRNINCSSKSGLFGRHSATADPALTYGGVNPSNRGFAALGDKVFMGTLDAHVLAFNRDTGKIVWDTVVDDYKVGQPSSPRRS
jgi:outer membrane protein assembly factor BamB